MTECLGKQRKPQACTAKAYLVEVFTSAESRSGEWLAISSRINTWLFSLFRQTKQPFWNPNRPASPKFNLVFACGYIAKRQHRMFSTAKLRGSHLKAGRVYTHHTHSYVCIYHTYINKNPIPY